jgi:hypothetical protein
MFKKDEVSLPAEFSANDAVRANTTLFIPNGPSTFDELTYDAVKEVSPSPPPPKMVTNTPSEPEGVTLTPLPVKLIFAVSVCTNELV